MSHQSQMADCIYGRLSTKPVSVACLVRELRDSWGPEHGVREVHRFVCEALACLLDYDDVEVGDIDADRFVAWTLERWDAFDKIEEDLMSLESFFDNDGKYVFRMRPAA